MRSPFDAQMLEDRVAELRSAVYDLQVRVLGAMATPDKQPLPKVIWGEWVSLKCRCI